MAKLETFSDPFNQASLSGSWTPNTAGSATLSYSTSGAQVNFPATTSSSTDADITSVSTYDLTSSYGYLQVLAVPSTSSHTDCTFAIRINVDNSVQWQWESGSLYAEFLAGGVQTNIGFITYDPVVHKYWRIRESGGTTFWDTSADGITWTNRFSHANPITLTSVSVNISGTAYGADSGNGPFAWNNFNVTGTPAAPAAPSGLTISVDNEYRTVLSWTDNSTAPYQATNFIIERGTDGISFTQVANVSANQIYYLDLLCSPNTLYYYRVKARNSYGDSAYTSVVSITTPAPGQPWTAKIQGWLYGTNPYSPIADYVDGRTIDTLKPEYMTVASGGVITEVDTPSGGAYAFNNPNAWSVKNYSNKQFITVSSGYANFHALMGSSTNQSNGITTLVNFCVNNGFSGVELDWEGFGSWTSGDYSTFKTFLSSLASSLHANNLQLMVDGPPIGDSSIYSDLAQSHYLFKYEEVAPLVDYICVLAYDYEYDYSAGSPVQPIAWLQTIITWAIQKVGWANRSKIIIGMPAYGYHGATGSYSITLDAYKDSVGYTGFSTATRDTTSQELMWTNGGNSYVYSDTVTLNAKRKVIEDMGVLNISVWYLGGNLWFNGRVEPNISKTHIGSQSTIVHPGRVPSNRMRFLTSPRSVDRASLTTVQLAFSDSITTSDTVTSATTASNVPQPIAKPDIPTTHLYKVFHQGTYLGLIKNVTSPFTYSQQINTAGAALTIIATVNSESALQTVEQLTDENYTPLTDELGNPLYPESMTPQFGPNGNNVLYQEGNDIQVWEISQYYPNGHQVFGGKVTRWQNNDGADNAIQLTVLSYGSDFSGYLITGTESIDQYNTTTDGNSYGVYSGVFASPFFNAGQTFTTSANVTTISAISIKATLVSTINSSINQVGIDLYTAPGGTYLGSTQQITVNNSGLTEYKLSFSSPITVSPSTSYFFVINTGWSETSTILVAYNSFDVYASGKAYIDYGDLGPPTGTGGLHESGWLAQSGDLYFKIYTHGVSTNDPHEDDDPANILLTIGNNYVSQGGLVTISNANIVSTGVKVTTQFKVNSFLEGIESCYSFSPYNFYWYADVASNQLYFKPANTVADFVLIKGRHITTLDLLYTTENVKNNVYFTGGQLSTGQNLFVHLTDTASIAKYGSRLERLSDTRVTDVDTAYALVRAYINRWKDGQYQTSVTIPATTCDISQFQVGWMIGFSGFGDFRDQLSLQCASKTPNSDNIQLQLGTLPKRASKQLDEINRALTAQQVIDNPAITS